MWQLGYAMFALFCEPLQDMAYCPTGSVYASAAMHQHGFGQPLKRPIDEVKALLQLPPSGLVIGGIRNFYGRYDEPLLAMSPRRLSLREYNRLMEKTKEELLAEAKAEAEQNLTDYLNAWSERLRVFIQGKLGRK